MSSGRGVDAEEVNAAVAVRDLDADVIAADGTGPVGDAVGVDLAADHSDGGGELVVGGDAGRLAAASGHGANQGGRGQEGSGDGGEHLGCEGELVLLNGARSDW